ncbi:MAG: nucleotide exchange factor GrpE [Vicinamibacterales bacterium]
MTEDNVKDPADQTPDVADPPGAQVDVAALRQERDDYYDRLLRKSAEFDNYRKRIERERREQAEQAVVDLLLDLLLVVDDFDRALTAESGAADASSYRKGVELIHGKLHDLLKKRGVTPIEAVGADFDPNLHQAVLHEPTPGRRENEVIEELRKGYMLRDRLLRAALVKVAKA